MNELPVFISYRQVDGEGLAFWLHDALLGEGCLIRNNGVDTPMVIVPYLDRAAAAVPDWRRLQSSELEYARAFLVVCTPHGQKERQKKRDWYFYEIHWWLENRPETPPILIYAARDNLEDVVPHLLDEKWPRAQRVKVDPVAFDGPASAGLSIGAKLSIQRSVESVVKGIAVSAGDTGLYSAPAANDLFGLVQSIPGVFYWEKDKYCRYLNVNENYARAAGFDSPRAMQRKTDDAMPWRSLADFFRKGDYDVMQGIPGSTREGVLEKEIMADRVADIVVHESPMRSRSGDIVGVTGCFIDISGNDYLPRTSGAMLSNGSFLLGDEFGGGRLSPIEVAVFRGLVRSYRAKQIAHSLGVSRSEIKSHMKSLQQKLGGSWGWDIVVNAVRAGLPLQLFDAAED